MKLSIKLLSLFLIIGTAAYAADTASILPPAKTTFFDQNGKPLTSGTVDFYIPSTTTRKVTWQDAGETILNTNPVILDAAGRALILGSGSYRQIVKDRQGNIIWDQVTSSAGSGGTTPTLIGDGQAVGTIHPWAGMTAPSQYVFTYGQEISRVTFAVAFSAITSSQAVFCTSGSPIITGLSDTTNFPIGAPVELSCVAAGFSTIISKTSTTLTLVANANVTINTTAVIFPWGRGNGTTTFNVPDFRGLIPAGNNNMGGTASANLTTTYFGATDPNSIGAAGGAQSKTLATANFPPYTPTGTNAAISVTSTSTTVLQSSGAPDNFTSVAGSTTFDNVTRSAIASTGAAPVFTGVAQGGTSTPFSLVQPTKTVNYIIKITPDASISTSSVVTSLGGMTGDIVCGSGVTCVGNVISSSTIATTISAGVTVVNGGPGVLQNPTNGGTLVSSLTLLSGVTAPNFTTTGNLVASGSASIGGANLSNLRTLVVRGSQPTLVFFDNAGTATFKAMGISYDGKNALTDSAIVFQNIDDNGAFVSNGTAIWRNGGVSVGSITNPGANSLSIPGISAGGIVYSTSAALAVLAGTVTAGQCLLSGSSAAPTWGSCAGPVASVSSVADSGSGTLTVSPTTGSVLAAINLAHSNTWTNKVGITTAVGTLNFDFETTGAVGSGQSTTATQGKIFGGSAGSPITTAVPLVAISRYEAITNNTQGGENPALWIESVGNNTSVAGTIAQVVALTAKSSQIGSGDVVGGYFSSTQNGSNIVSRSSSGYGVFVATTGSNSGNSVYGIENITNNSTGQNLDYATFISGGFNGIIGYEIAASGANISTAALWVRSNCIVLVCGIYDVGVGFNPNSIQTASIRDDSNAITSYLLVGSHTNGIDTTFGAFSGSVIKGTGYSISNTGAIALNGIYSTSNGGLIMLNSHATAGDTAVVLGVGSNGSADSSSIYVNFITPNAAAQAGTILRNDSAGTRHVSYNTTSDQRLKVDMGLFTGSLAKLAKIKVHKYHGLNYTGTNYNVGFFAQELYEQYPWCVTPSNDVDFYKHPWQVDYGCLTPLLVSSIQELKTEVEKLKRKIK
jgi:microcystin-dependent protein